MKIAKAKKATKAQLEKAKKATSSGNARNPELLSVLETLGDKIGHVATIVTSKGKENRSVKNSVYRYNKKNRGTKKGYLVMLNEEKGEMITTRIFSTERGTGK